MIIKNAAPIDLEEALSRVNLKYGNNIVWNRKPEPIGRRFRCTLRVISSRGPGHRIGFTGRHLISACWHVHGDFFDALFDINPNIVIVSRGKEITRATNWEDYNVGSLLYPMYASEACECH
jgi:hypothetical protein